MTPQERLEFEALKKQVQSLIAVENVSFIENIIRRCITRLSVTDLPLLKLSDLSDVSNTDSAGTGTVLKKTSTTWQPGTDNT